MLHATNTDNPFARRRGYAGGVLALAAVYFIAGTLGLRLAFVHANATAVWPPTGIALAALLVLGYRVWTAIFLGALVVNICTPGLAGTLTGGASGVAPAGLLDAFQANISRVVSVATSLGIATGNTLEA